MRRKRRRRQKKTIELHDRLRLGHGVYEVYEITENISGEAEIRASKVDFAGSIVQTETLDITLNL